MARTQHASKIPRKKLSQAPASAPVPALPLAPVSVSVPAPASALAPRRSCSENFDSIADDVVGEIIKKACQTVEERLEDIEETDANDYEEEEDEEEDDDIWPTNEKYNIERGRDAINKCLSIR